MKYKVTEYWKDMNGRMHRVDDMPDRYLRNVLRHLERTAYRSIYPNDLWGPEENAIEAVRATAIYRAMQEELATRPRWKRTWLVLKHLPSELKWRWRS